MLRAYLLLLYMSVHYIIHQQTNKLKRLLVKILDHTHYPDETSSSHLHYTVQLQIVRAEAVVVHYIDTQIEEEESFLIYKYIV